MSPMPILGRPRSLDGRAHPVGTRIFRCFTGEGKRNGAPGEIRTPDLLLRRQSLYPAELRARSNSISLHGPEARFKRPPAAEKGPTAACSTESNFMLSQSCVRTGGPSTGRPHTMYTSVMSGLDLHQRNGKNLPAVAPAAATTASATIATAIASTAAGPLCLWPCLINVQRTPANLRTIECGNGFLSILIAGHFHKTKSARPPGIAVSHDAYAVNLSVSLKELPQFVFVGVEAKVSYKNILHVVCPCIELSEVQAQFGGLGRSGGPS